MKKPKMCQSFSDMGVGEVKNFRNSPRLCQKNGAFMMSFLVLIQVYSIRPTLSGTWEA